YFISRQLDGWQERRVAEQTAHPRMPEIAAGVGRLISRLHRAGVWMKDASPGNILWHTGPDGNMHFALVDINRMDFDVHTPGILMRNFGRLFAGEAPTLAAARAYAKDAGEDETSIEREAIRQRQLAARKFARKQRLKKILRI
ncbi:MAG: lipopolysaccharide kinase InaA family protein, partial [Muribaculaceae bacterium]|nr:lipopolysaccharide kinase InaA family protein [Muribaculaceae bacterium]